MSFLIYTSPVVGFYYGAAEDKIDLTYIKDIIDGVSVPDDPNICTDFAERLHNNAEMAGIRCAYVHVDLSNSNAGHACNAFETTDKGLIYIDCTGTENSYGPSHKDTTVDIEIGKDYIPKSLFPESGWQSMWERMGTVTDVETIWDGEWR
jgi:hypothetical protein